MVVAFQQKHGASASRSCAWLVGVSIIVFVNGFVAGEVAASETRFQSTATQVGLLELYTSEGCSSCPPADRWISELKRDDRLWHDFIPVSFHVDYWDYIGWKDRYASQQYSQRQRRYERERAVSTVYTPGFVYNGQEWRRWFKNKAHDFPDANESGILQLTLSDDIAHIHYQPVNDDSDELHVTLVLLGFDLSTPVRAGENKGRRLEHDFVVLGMTQNRLQRTDLSFDTSVAVPESEIAAPRYAVAAWVSTAGKQKPLQAVGGWLPDL